MAEDGGDGGGDGEVVVAGRDDAGRSCTASEGFAEVEQRVAMPRPLAPERATLVAPMLPLPVARMSCLRKMRTSR